MVVGTSGFATDVSEERAIRAALLESEATGAMSTLAMAGAAVFTAAVAPAYIPALLRLLAA